MIVVFIIYFSGCLCHRGLSRLSSLSQKSASLTMSTVSWSIIHPLGCDDDDCPITLTVYSSSFISPIALTVYSSFIID